MRRLFITLFIILGAFLFAEKPPLWDEPEYIRTILAEEEKAAGLPKGLAHCLAFEESKFDPLAKSRWVKGFQSRGLTQIYAKYQDYIIKLVGMDPKTFDWTNPRQSARAGCRYLKYLITYFGGSNYLGVLAYNFGLTNVRNITKLSDIPVRCVTYTDNILRNWKEWDPSW